MINQIESNAPIITLTRGDYIGFPIKINIGTKIVPVYYSLRDNDKLYVGIMESHQKFEEAIVRKKFTKDSKKDEDGNILVELFSEDTENLLDGTYYYTAKLVQTENNKEYVTTVLPNTLFYIRD